MVVAKSQHTAQIRTTLQRQDYDESSGIGIFADAGSDVNGRIVTRIDRSTITADTAMKFVDGRTMLEMEYATITGDIEFDLTGDTAVAIE